MSSNPKCESKRNLALMPVRTRLDAEGQSTSAYVVVFPSSAQVPGDGPDILLNIRRLRESADPVIPVYSISYALQSSGIPATPPRTVGTRNLVRPTRSRLDHHVHQVTSRIPCWTPFEAPCMEELLS